MIFCDTSYAAKLYVPEAESASVRAHLEGYAGEVCLSELARAELFGVFHRRLRENRWTSAEFSAAARQFQQSSRRRQPSFISRCRPTCLCAPRIACT
jgi:predicted nucleic acid-binding protein